MPQQYTPKKLVTLYHEGFDKIAEFAEMMARHTQCDSDTVRLIAQVARNMQRHYALEAEEPLIVTNKENRYEPKRRELEDVNAAYRNGPGDGVARGRYKQTAFEKEARQQGREADPTAAHRDRSKVDES